MWAIAIDPAAYTLRSLWLLMMRARHSASFVLANVAL